MTPTERLLRTLFQVIAAGGLTAAVNQLSDGLSGNVKVIVGVAWLLVVTYAQNELEERGTIKPILKGEQP